MTTTEKSVTDVLREARALVERGWCQGWYAKDAQGRAVDEDDPRACSWCMSGAIRLASTRLGFNAARIVAEIGSEQGMRPSVPNWQDNQYRKKADVLAAFDKAIALREAQV